MKHFLFYLTVTSTLFFSGCKKGADAESPNDKPKGPMVWHYVIEEDGELKDFGRVEEIRAEDIANKNVRFLMLEDETVYGDFEDFKGKKLNAVWTHGSQNPLLEILIIVMQSILNNPKAEIVDIKNEIFVNVDNQEGDISSFKTNLGFNMWKILDGIQNIPSQIHIQGRTVLLAGRKMDIFNQENFKIKDEKIRKSFKMKMMYAPLREMEANIYFNYFTKERNPWENIILYRGEKHYSTFNK